MLCSTLSTSSNSSRASMMSIFFSKSSSVHSIGAFVTHTRLTFISSCPKDLTASAIIPASFGSVKITEVPSSSPSSNSMSSHPASMAASKRSSSSTLAGTSTFPFRSYMKSTDPCSAIFPPRLLTVDFTSAVDRLGLSERTLTIMEAPPKPYASKVDSAKSPEAGSDAFLMARSMLSTGTLLALAALITSRKTVLLTVSGPPPCLTAIIIFFPYTALIFAFLASVLDLVAARTAAARPMKSGEQMDVLSEDDTVDVFGAETKGRIENDSAPETNNESASREVESFILTREDGRRKRRRRFDEFKSEPQ
mmetsp:Transcript_24511/g.35017  ORF Transcript_24511/g.35017 Transcript_24511/m.35017 type:complete len:308 (+) Transcript_24511:89-1012(+)